MDSDVILLEKPSPQEVLAHHGVKGMKWGVRNDETRRKYEGGHKRQRTPEEKKRLRRRIAVGTAVGVTAATIAGYAIYKHKVGSVDKSAVEKGAAAVAKAAGQATRTGKSASQIDARMVKNLNPTKNNHNCGSCSIGYIMNSMFGGSYKANPTDNGLKMSEMIPKMFDGVKHTVPDYESPRKSLDRIANGSTGILTFHTKSGGGHAINFEKSSKGVLTLIDGQTGYVMESGGNAIETYIKSFMGDVTGIFDFTEAKPAATASIFTQVLLHR